MLLVMQWYVVADPPTRSLSPSIDDSSLVCISTCGSSGDLRPSHQQRATSLCVGAGLRVRKDSLTTAPRT